LKLSIMILPCNIYINNAHHSILVKLKLSIRDIAM
jgi:hypothetical protein